jgi:hypothetical protein
LGLRVASGTLAGKNIQCFAHPNFRREAGKDMLDKITRKTARSLKKCKREVIKELQLSEAQYRKRMRELESLISRKEQQNGLLEKKNAQLAMEVQKLQAEHQDGSSVTSSNKLYNLPVEFCSSPAPLVPLIRMHSSSSSSSGSSSFPNSTNTGVYPASCYNSYGNSRPGSPSQGTNMNSSLAPSLSSTPHPNYYSLSRTTSSSASSMCGNLPAEAGEPMLEMVSDYSEESPLFYKDFSQFYANGFSSNNVGGLSQNQRATLAPANQCHEVGGVYMEDAMLLDSLDEIEQGSAPSAPLSQ